MASGDGGPVRIEGELTPIRPPASAKAPKLGEGATPGPWRCFVAKNGGLLGIGDKDGNGILDGRGGVWLWDDPEGKANAALLAKAWLIPELRDALDHCRNVIHEHLARPGIELEGFFRGAEEVAIAVLAKVGEE